MFFIMVSVSWSTKKNNFPQNDSLCNSGLLFVITDL